MYTGEWARDFVRIVRREGGEATAEDLERYKPTWIEPRRTTVFGGHTVYTNGAPHTGGCELITGLNLAEALKLEEQEPYWEDADTFLALSRAVQCAHLKQMADIAWVDVGKNVVDRLGEMVWTDGSLGKEQAKVVAPLLERIVPLKGKGNTAGGEEKPQYPKHSNSVVVVDGEGNVVALTHTINTIWGDTGMVVGGIPLLDSAGFQQIPLAKINPCPTPSWTPSHWMRPAPQCWPRPA